MSLVRLLMLAAVFIAHGGDQLQESLQARNWLNQTRVPSFISLPSTKKIGAVTSSGGGGFRARLGVFRQTVRTFLRQKKDTIGTQRVRVNEDVLYVNKNIINNIKKNISNSSGTGSGANSSSSDDNNISVSRSSNSNSSSSSIYYQKNNNNDRIGINNSNSLDNNEGNPATDIPLPGVSSPRFPVSTSKKARDIWSLTIPLLKFKHLKYKDKFKCDPCICHYDLNNKTTAVCNMSGINFSDYKNGLPEETVFMEIRDSNILKYYNFDNFRKFTSLNSLTLNDNKYLEVVNKTSEHVYTFLSLQKLDLSNNQISLIEDGSFYNTPNLMNLSISENKISVITNLTFLGLKNLKFLNLSDNCIQRFEAGSLQHFKYLFFLGAGLKQTIDLDVNCGSEELPKTKEEAGSVNQDLNSELAHLSSLQQLRIDGIDQDFVFGSEFSNLTHLRILTIGSFRENRCFLRTITNTLFQNLKSLFRITVIRCPLENITNEAFTHIIKLSTLELIKTLPHTMTRDIEELRGLLNTSRFKHLSLIYRFPNNILYEIFGKQFSILQHSHISELDLSQIPVVSIQKEFFKSLPLSLEKIVLRNNFLIDSSVVLENALRRSNLKNLDLGNDYTFNKKAKRNCDEDDKHLSDGTEFEIEDVLLFERKLKRNVLENNDEKMHSYPNRGDIYKSVVLDNQHIHSAFTNTNWDRKVKRPMGTINFSNNIRLNLTHVVHLAKNVSKIRYLDVSYCSLHDLNNHLRFPPNIKAINLEGNYIKNLPCNIFAASSSLKYLSLANNLLGETFGMENRQYFQNLSNLIYMDISLNNICEIPEDFFKGLKSLRILIMKSNKIHYLNTNFSWTPSLEYLDLKKNSITWIRPSTRNDLDTINLSRHLFIDMSLNPLRCSCEGLELVFWIRMSNIKFLSTGNIRCQRNDGIIEDLGGFSVRLSALQRYCSSDFVFLALALLYFIVLSIVVTYGLIYRYRWQLRYFRSIVLSKIAGFKPRKTLTDSVYKFDAFIIYSNSASTFVFDDCMRELEAKRGHKLCIDDRDFLPGTFAISAIISAIQNSHKTVVVVTSDFYEQVYTEYAIKMAQMEEIYAKRSVLHLCLLEAPPKDHMNEKQDLLIVMKKNLFTEYPPKKEVNQQILDNFWSEMSKVIGHLVENADGKLG